MQIGLPIRCLIFAEISLNLQLQAAAASAVRVGSGDLKHMVAHLP
jgi:hypothetical protein